MHVPVTTAIIKSASRAIDINLLLFDLDLDTFPLAAMAAGWSKTKVKDMKTDGFMF